MRTLVCDDDPLVRRVVVDALRSDGLVVVAQAADGREAVELTRHYRPDVVLVDLVMPGLDGLAVTRAVQEASPDTRVVLLTTSEEPSLPLAAVLAGAVGCLPKSLDLRTLPRVLRGVARGEAAMGRTTVLGLLDVLRQAHVGGDGLRPVRSTLTDREWEVLDLLCRGRSTSEVADELVLSEETVRTHVKRILRKLDVHSRAAAVAAAARLREV